MKETQSVNIDTDRARTVMDIEKLHSTLNLIHRQSAEHALKRREAAVEGHNRKPGGRKITVEAGDYVLRGKCIRTRGENFHSSGKAPIK